MSQDDLTRREHPPAHPSGAVGFDLGKLLHVLAKHEVSYIIIGGIASVLHGSSSLTRDLDVCYDRGRPNLQALAAALRELHVSLPGTDPGLPFQVDARSLEMGDHFTFLTDAGPLDCLGTPAGTRGYSDLIEKAEEYELGGLTVKVASLDDLIRMKRASGRPKDRIELEILGALRDEIDGEEG